MLMDNNETQQTGASKRWVDFTRKPGPADDLMAILVGLDLSDVLELMRTFDDRTWFRVTLQAMCASETPADLEAFHEEYFPYVRDNAPDEYREWWLRTYRRMWDCFTGGHS